MFGFVKELYLIGQVSNAFGKIVLKFCHEDYLGRLSNRKRNLLIEEALKIVSGLHRKPLTSVTDLPFDDLMVAGFLLLAREIGPANGIDHHFVLMGLMTYILATIDQDGYLSPDLLKEANTYLTSHSIGGVLNDLTSMGGGTEKIPAPDKADPIISPIKSESPPSAKTSKSSFKSFSSYDESKKFQDSLVINSNKTSTTLPSLTIKCIRCQAILKKGEFVKSDLGSDWVRCLKCNMQFQK